MARKDVLMNLTSPVAERPKDTGSSNYAMRGASKSMLSSIGELSAQAARAEKLLEGGYLRSLTEKARGGEFSVGTMLMAGLKTNGVMVSERISA